MQRYIQEDSNLQNHFCENLILYKPLSFTGLKPPTDLFEYLNVLFCKNILNVYMVRCAEAKEIDRNTKQFPVLLTVTLAENLR
jgi:hypothetical protein